MERFARTGRRFCTRGWRDYTAGKRKGTNGKKLNKRGKEGMDTWKDYDITTRRKKHNGVVKKVLLAR